MGNIFPMYNEKCCWKEEWVDTFLIILQKKAWQPWIKHEVFLLSIKQWQWHTHPHSLDGDKEIRTQTKDELWYIFIWIKYLTKEWITWQYHSLASWYLIFNAKLMSFYLHVHETSRTLRYMLQSGNLKVCLLFIFPFI